MCTPDIGGRVKICSANLSRDRRRKSAQPCVAPTLVCLQVILIAVMLIQNSQFSGKGTQGLVNTEVLPSACASINALFPTDGHCFQLDLSVSTGFYLTLAATFTFFLSGMAGSPTNKYLHRCLYPEDPHPPPNWSTPCLSRQRKADEVAAHYH